MDDYRMARRVLMAEASGGHLRGRLRLGWMNGVKVALGNRGMTVEAIIIIIIKKDWQCKAGRGRLPPYHSEDPSPTVPTYRGKKRKGNQFETKKYRATRPTKRHWTWS